MASNFKPFWRDFEAKQDSNIFLIEGDLAQSYRDVFAAGDRIFGGYKRGLVAILCDKSAATVTAYFGALRNGLVPILLDVDAKPAALERIFQAYRPEYVFDPKGRIRHGYELASKKAGSVISTLKARASPPPHPDLALLLSTSGSTGDPKFVRISYKSLDACTQSICDYLDLTPERRCISLLPLHYSYGLSVLNTAAARRASFVLSDLSVLDRDFWRQMAELCVTDLSGVPFIFEMMRRIPLPPEVLDNLKCVTQAGGRLDPKLTRLFFEKFSENQIRFFTMYGQTEASPRIAYLPPERAVEKAGSVGVPISCGTALIAETGKPTGEGELLYKGENVALGYAYSRDDIVLGDQFAGKLLTGDHVRIDEDGYIFVVGRRKRFIKLHGISVNLDHIEAVLKSASVDCAVVGRENLVLICCAGSDVASVTSIVDDNFAFHPSSIRIRELDTLPRHTNGKLNYTALSEQFL